MVHREERNHVRSNAGLLLALAILLFLVGWVPFLDLLQRAIRNHREAAAAALRSLRISRR
jgi:beta-lactamase regulating signal transducer with metallopeptidase domain